jgi:hypothetical protein
MIYASSKDFRELDRQVGEWVKALPADYEKQEKFFCLTKGEPGFSDWKEVISSIWNREKAIIHLELLDYAAERMKERVEKDRKLMGKIGSAKKYFEQALEVYNRQFVLYYISKGELSRQKGDMELLNGIPVDTIRAACGKGNTLESHYYFFGNGYYSQGRGELSSLSTHELGSVFAPLSPQELAEALKIRMKGRGPEVYPVGKEKPSPGTASS